MNKLQLLFLVAILSVFSSCKKDEFGDVEPVSLSLKVSLEQSLSTYGFSLANTEIKMTNLSNGQVNTVKTDDVGNFQFDNLTAGNYDIQASLKISAATYTSITGIPQTEEVIFNGLLKGQAVTEDTKNLSLEMRTGRIGDWVFKQIYYAGSHTTNGAVFRDVFVEVYNNSNEILYADSLCFAQVFGINTKTTSLDGSLSYLRSNKQYDWSKSIGNSVTRANEDYIYAKSLYMIPGTGKQHPVQPGGSIIIAATAINHKTPYTDLDGKSISVKDPTLTVDLSGADFEVYLGDQPGINPLASDVNNPAVPNMKVISTGGDRDLVLQVGGRDAYALIKANVEFSAFGRIPTPNVLEITTSTDLFIRIPSSYVVDAVETQPPVSANQFPKKLESNLDATYTFVSKGQYSSQSLIRKTAKTVNGRRVLQDTNNSNSDFTELDYPDVTKTVFR